MSDFVIVEHQARVCTITLNRPDSLNALNAELFAQLSAAIQAVGAMGSDVGCVILKGAGKAFSGGHDLKDISSGAAQENPEEEALILEALAALPQPVIAQVHGYCFTGALELALAADLIFIDENTRLADTHSKWGLSPIWGMTQRLPRRIGAARAKDMMFSSRLVGAQESLAIGLVDRVCGVSELEQKVWEYAQSVVTNSPHSHKICKAIVAATDGLRLPEGLDYEYTNSPGECQDMKQRLQAFAQRSAEKAKA